MRAPKQGGVAVDGLQSADADLGERAAGEVFGDELLRKEAGAVPASTRRRAVSIAISTDVRDSSARAVMT